MSAGAPVRARERTRPSEVTAWTVLAVTVVAFVVSLVVVALDGHKLSTVDEHVHLDYAYRLHEGVVPLRGMPYSDALVEEWACGVGHEAGDIAYPCGAPEIGPDVLPSGRWSTAYIHYPTYFVGAEALRRGLDATGSGLDAVSAYRLSSAILLGLGVLVTVVGARAAGARGSRLVLASLVPVAASSIAFLGTVVNPMSLALLQGALIAFAGVRWMRTGRGFWWLLAATAFAAGTAVTHSLPVGAFGLAAVVALVGRRRLRVDSPWQPRSWQVAALAAVVVTPVVVWGKVISMRAAVPNDTLYGFAAPGDAASVVSGFFRELTSLHVAWLDTGQLPAQGIVLAPLRAAAGGLTGWVPVLVAGALVLAALGALRRGPAELLAVPGASAGSAASSDRAHVAAAPAADDRALPAADEAPDETEVASHAARGPRLVHPLLLLTVATLLTIVLYPPALRTANVLNFGFDFPIVSRYSIGFGPLLAVLVALLVPGRALPRLLAGVAVVTVLGLSFSWV
ncbi:hypothetical protein [Actinotalea solisilvae]|uniref:hypothetical protein n=1 Tax=Actinotalea solisilvae TaxID=2072922 RepID=UPI0018F2176F|nr:hypothetical protein [Actinotalea solisilvae]